MRQVFRPTSAKSRSIWTLAGALLLTLGVFLVLPLTQMVSGSVSTVWVIPEVDVIQLNLPVTEETPPPEIPKKEEQEPPPELTDTLPRLVIPFDSDLLRGVEPLLRVYPLDRRDVRGSEDPFASFDVEKQPELIASVPPQYPATLRKAGVEGAVTVIFMVDENGHVQNPRVENSSRPEFEQPALDSIKRWKFKPGMKDGDAVPTYMRLPIKFRVI